jgi:DHA1 family bicyclomycin/chloramphenicol resistance-like MFS transporter
VFVGAFAAIGAVAYGAVLGETHNSTRIPLNPLAIAKNYFGLVADRRFLIPAATVSLIMGGLFAMFSAAPRVLIEGLHFSPIQLGLFFAGTVMIVFAAGMLATKLAPRFGLDRSIRAGLLTPGYACSCSAWASSIRSAPRKRCRRSARRPGRPRRCWASGR